MAILLLYPKLNTMSSDYQLLTTARVTASQLHRGTMALGIVANVRPAYMLVNLPFGIIGSISDTNAMDSEDVLPLTELYKAGDYVLCVVVGQDAAGKPVLSLKPSLFHQRDFSRKSLVICQIETVEDHGWIAEVKDSRGTSCFLSKSRVPEELHPRLKPGLVIQCAVVDINASGTLLQVSLQKLDLTATASFDGYNHVIPGQIVKAEVVHNASTHSVMRLISTGGKPSQKGARSVKYYGYILSEHFRRPSDPGSGYATYTGFQGKFKVIYVDLNPQSTDVDGPLVYISNMDSILDHIAPTQIYSVGQVLQEGKLTMVQTMKGAVYASLSSDLSSFVYIPVESTHHGAAADAQIGEPINLKVKILGYRQFDDLYIGTANPGDIVSSTEAEYHSGMVIDRKVPVKVTKVLDSGVHVSIEVSPTHTLHGMINQPHYGSHLKGHNIPIGLNINKNHGTLRVIAYDEPRQVYYLSLANLGSEPLFSSRDTVKPGMVSRGVVTSFIDNAKCSAVIQFTNLYNGICANATGMEVGQVYEFICVRNDEKYTTVDRLSESQRGDDIARLRSNYADGLMRVLDYRHFIKFELPYSFTVDGSSSTNLPLGTILNKDNATIEIRSIALGGFKLNVKLSGDHDEPIHVFLPHGCIAFPGKSAELVKLYLGANDSNEEQDFFSILPFVRLVTMLSTRDKVSVYIGASSNFLANEEHILPEETGAMTRGNTYQAVVTHMSASGLTARVSSNTEIFYPDFGNRELDGISPLTLIQVRVVKVGDRRAGRDRKVDVSISGYCQNGILRALPGTQEADTIADSSIKIKYTKLALPQTQQLNTGILSVDDCRHGATLKGSYLFSNTSPDAYCAIYDMGSGIVGRMTLEAVLLSRLVAKIIDTPIKSLSLASLLADFSEEVTKFISGGDLTLTAYFEKHGHQSTSDGVADVCVRSIVTLYGEQELSTICADVDPLAGEQSCEVVDLYPASLSPSNIKTLHSVLSKFGCISIGMVRYVSEHHMILRDIIDNCFVFVHAVDVFETPSAVRPLREIYKQGSLIPITSFTSKEVPGPVIVAGINRIGIPDSLEESILSSPMNMCSIAMTKPTNTLTGLQHTICQVLPSGALRLNGYTSMCFLTATSPVEFCGRRGLFMSPVLSVTRLFNDPQDFSKHIDDFIHDFLGYHKCVRIGPDNVSLRPIDFQVSSMSRHSFISVGQERLFLPQTAEDLSIHDTYVGFIRPYSKIGAGLHVVVSESVTIHVKMKEISEEFISPEEAQDKYPSNTMVRVRYLETSMFNDMPQYNGTIKPTVVNNPNIKHPSVIIKTGACLIGRVDNVADDRGVFITVEDCYPLTRVRARISDSIDVSGHGAVDNEKIVLNNANRCSSNYYKGQRLYFIVLEPTAKGATVGLKTAHFLTAGIDITKLPILKQNRTRRSKQDKSHAIHQEELLNQAMTNSDAPATKLPVLEVSQSKLEPARKRMHNYDFFAGELDDDHEKSQDSERQQENKKQEVTAESDSSDTEGPIINFLNFGTMKHAATDESSYSDDYEEGNDILDEGKREYEMRQAPKLTAEQKRAKEERNVREKEEELLTNAAPQSEADFERLLAGNEYSSYLWIRYVAFHVDRANIDKAEAVIDRAMTKICPDKEVDYRNLWLAKIALKEKFHGSEAGANELYEAIRRNESNELLRIYCSGKLDQGDWEAAARGYDLLFSKKERKRVYENWRDYFLFLYNAKGYNIPTNIVEGNRTKARGQELQKASSCLSQDALLRLFCDSARAEYKIGDITRGRAAFDKLVGTMPQRMDIWGQYLDMEEKHVAPINPHDVRSLYERCCALRLSLKKMSYVLKRFYNFEKKFGTATTQEHVKEIARAYADS